MSIPIIQKLVEAWQSGDPDRVAALFAPDARWVIDGQALEGRAEIAMAGAASMANAKAVRIVLRRAFSDKREPNWHVAEWAFRMKPADPSQVDTSTGDSRECEQGVLIHEQDGQIVYMRTHNDKFRMCSIAWDAPLRPESRPTTLPTPQQEMTVDDVIVLQNRHVMHGWRLGNADTVTSSHMPHSVILNAWTTVDGHDNIRASVRKYTENFKDTHIDIHRVVYDGQNVAVNQTWSCTNCVTGVRAGDEDLIIGVIQDGKIWYWREYFDPEQSTQTLEQVLFN